MFVRMSVCNLDNVGTTQTCVLLQEILLNFQPHKSSKAKVKTENLIIDNNWSTLFGGNVASC